MRSSQKGTDTVVTRSEPRSVRRAARAAQAARVGLVVAAGGLAVVGPTGGTAFAGIGQFNRPSPDGGAPVRTHGVHASDGDRQVNDRSAGKVAAAKPKTPTAKAGTKTSTKTSTKVKTKVKIKAKAVQHKKV